MSIKTILKMGNPKLLEKSKPVTNFDVALKTIVNDLWETMEAHNGAGLAAPQIGIPLKIITIGFQKNPRYPNAKPVPKTLLINPSIEVLDDDTNSDWEGCLSLPGLRGKVPRHKHIRCNYQDIEGNHLSLEAFDFHARVIQHECDHLNGILYPMQISEFDQFGFIEELELGH